MTDAQLTNCMLVSRSEEFVFEFRERVYFMPIRLGGVLDKQNWIPSGKMEHSSVSEIAVMRR